MNALEYRPHLEYKRRINAVLHQYEDTHPEDQLNTKPSDQLGRTNYTPSQALKDAVDLTPTDVLLAHVTAKGKIATLIDKIVLNIRKDVTTTPSVDDYIKAKEENDLDTIYQFEDYHSGHIDGSTSAEVLPVLDYFQDELNELSDFLHDYLFPDEPSSDLDYLYSQIDKLIQEEEAMIQQWIQDDINVYLDESKLNEQNHVLDFLKATADTISQFVDEVDAIISSTPESIYHNMGSQIVEIANQQNTLKKQFVKLNLRRFDKAKANTEDALNRLMRLADYNYKKNLLKEVVQFQQDKLDAKTAVPALYAINPESEDDLINIFLMDMTDEIGSLKEECDALVEDLYKIKELENMQTVDYLTSLEGKNVCRYLKSLLGG